MRVVPLQVSTGGQQEDQTGVGQLALDSHRARHSTLNTATLPGRPRRVTASEPLSALKQSNQPGRFARLSD